MTVGTVAARGLWDICSKGDELEVLGVFGSAIYLRGACGNVLMLHDSRYGSLPFGVSVEGLAGHGRALGLEPGDRLRLSEGRLFAPSGSFELELCYRESGRATVKAMDADAMRSLYGDICAALKAEPKANGLPLSLDREMSEAMRLSEDGFIRAGARGMSMLCAGLREGRAEELADALDSLLGLGRGLTPSFDDLLCGLCFTLNALCPEDALCSVLNRLLLRQAPLRTNSYSAAYLLAAASGGDFSLLRELLNSRSEPGRRAAVAAVLAVGSSSGGDMLCGVALGLDWLLRQRAGRDL